MSYTTENLERIFHRTSGKCHVCHKKLAFKNYGLLGKRGAWEVEHSLARANGGSDHLNNFYPAHIICNRKKGLLGTRAARSRNGKARAPLSTSAREKRKIENAIWGGILGALAGGLLGPGPRLLCVALGALTGHRSNPDA